MGQKSLPPESPGGSAEASAVTPQAEAATPLDRFKNLTRRLLQVSRDELAEEERKHMEKQSASRRDKS